MRIPQRFNVVPAYFANFLRPLVPAPRFLDLLRFLAQPGKEQRARRFIERTESEAEYTKVFFHAFPQYPLFFPKGYRWVDFCQTVDECFNARNWHHFLSPRFSLSPSDVVVDCGAAEGLFTFISSMRGAKVFAFEPDAGFVEGMRQTFSNLPNVVVHQCALGHKSGTAFLSRNEIFSRITGEGKGTEVSIRTLDAALDGENVTFIKADVEGFEFRVLLGAETLIRANRPKLALTVYHPQNNVDEMKDFL
jgi:FkbM family methyltransferase